MGPGQIARLSHILDSAPHVVWIRLCILIAAAKAGDTSGFDTARARWYANAVDIAAFLSGANPDNWPLAALQAEMKMHLGLTLQEAADRLAGDYAADIADYDAVHDHILHMADTLSAGIMAQFPNQFNRPRPGGTPK